MNTPSERNVFAHVFAVKLELIRIVELSRVAVGRSQAKHQNGTGLDGYTRESGGLAGQAEIHLGRTLHAQCLFDERAD